MTLGIYALWPTWERSTLPDTTADLIEADRAFLGALLACWQDPSSQDREELRRARERARVARTNTEAAVQRALEDPARDTARFRHSASDRRAGESPALRRRLPRPRGVPRGRLRPRPPRHAFSPDQLDSALAELAGAAREHRAPGSLPPLRETQLALSTRVGATAPLAEETDRIVNSVFVAADVLSRPEASRDQTAAVASGPSPTTV